MPKLTKPKYDARPGEAVVVAAPSPIGSLHLFVLAPWLRRGYTDQPVFVLAPDVPYLLPDRAVAAGADGYKMIERGELRVIDDQRGIIPEVVDISDTHRRAELRDGVRPGPNWRERIDDLRGRYIADDSFCEAVLGLIDSGGWSEVEAVAALQRTYTEAFMHGRAAQKPWIAEAVRLLEERGFDVKTYGLQGVRQAVRDSKTAQADDALTAQKGR